ncbi:hypothetical protein NKI20_09355 [Mesorhizobium sp. M0830]
MASLALSDAFLEALQAELGVAKFVSCLMPPVASEAEVVISSHSSSAGS